MAEIKEKHPSWFKMKIERRELIRQLSPETAVKVLLACWDFLETGEKSTGLSPIESVAFASFMPDMTEAWASYIQRVTARNNKDKSNDIDRCRSTSHDTEEETEEDSLLLRNKDRKRGADKPPPRSRFIPPTVEDVSAYCRERGYHVDAEAFVAFYEAKNWYIGKNKMKNWKSALVTWE